MIRNLVCMAALFLLYGSSFNHAATPIDPAKDWPCWRGPTGTGVAAVDQTPPLKWSKDQKVVWKAFGRTVKLPVSCRSIV